MHPLPPLVHIIFSLFLLSDHTEANLSGRVTSTVTKFATSVFQHDDPVTLNAQGHGHNFIDRIAAIHCDPSQL
jgi:hypothetical protein